MSKDIEPSDLENISDDELVEIDWEPLQGAIDALHEADLDFTDNRNLLDHWGALLGALLRKVYAEEGLEEEEVAELAAEAAAFGIDLAFGPEELPDFAPSEPSDAN